MNKFKPGMLIEYLSSQAPPYRKDFIGAKVRLLWSTGISWYVRVEADIPGYFTKGNEYSTTAPMTNPELFKIIHPAVFLYD